jgi:hypothetical protein
MVRTYQRKRIKKYTPEQVSEAVNNIKNGMTIVEAAAIYKISESTLGDHARGQHSRKSGGQTVLSEEEEFYIAKTVVHCSKFGWPCTRCDLRRMINEYCFSKKMVTPWDPCLGPGDDFLRNFERRQANILCRRNPELLTLSRAKSLTNDTLDSFFEMVSYFSRNLFFLLNRLVYNSHFVSLSS